MRRIRARAAREAPRPRRGGRSPTRSRELAKRGIERRRASRALLDRAEIRLVMTAHPTEARRRTTIDKQARVFRELRALDEQLGRDERGRPASGSARPSRSCGDLMSSRAISLTVLDEVRGGLVHFTSTLADTVPRVYRDLEQALARAVPARAETFAVPPLLRFGSWIGGDRDGNPNVTPETTGAGARADARAVPALPRGRGSSCSPDGSRSPTGSAVRRRGSSRSSSVGEQTFPALAEQLAALNPEEPYRRALTFMRERVRATTARRRAGGYATRAELLDDLRIVERSLDERRRRSSPPPATCAT